MNEQPHIHTVEIKDHLHYWTVAYGDQVMFPEKPWFFKRWRSQWRLARAIRRVIKRHDRGSLLAGANQERIKAVIPKLEAGRWGSEQLR